MLHYWTFDHMEPVSSIVVFVIIWWSVLFCILPVGIANTYDADDENNKFQAPGAPKSFDLKKKLILTTAITLIIWSVICVFIVMNIFDFRQWALGGFEP